MHARLMCQQDHHKDTVQLSPKVQCPTSTNASPRYQDAPPGDREELPFLTLDIGRWTLDVSEDLVLAKYFKRPVEGKRFNRVALTGDCRGAKEGIIDSLLGCFDDGEK